MHTIELDLKTGLVLVDSAGVSVDEKGALAGSIAKLCSTPIKTDAGVTTYRLLKKASVCGKSADCVIEIGEGKLCSITFLFDFIEFFESSVLESKVLKTCEKSSNVNFVSDHPTTAFLTSQKWGQARFFYDPKQGDLSLEIVFQCI